MPTFADTTLYKVVSALGGSAYVWAETTVSMSYLPACCSARGSVVQFCKSKTKQSSLNGNNGRWFRHQDARRVFLVLLQRSHKLCMRWFCSSKQQVAMRVRCVRVHGHARWCLNASGFTRCQTGDRLFLQILIRYATEPFHIGNYIIVAFPDHVSRRRRGWRGWRRRCWRGWRWRCWRRIRRLAPWRPSWRSVDQRAVALVLPCNETGAVHSEAAKPSRGSFGVKLERALRHLVLVRLGWAVDVRCSHPVVVNALWMCMMSQ